MNKKILLTGTSGAMGSQALKYVLGSKHKFDVVILLRDKPSNRKYADKLLKDHDIKVVFGDLANYDDCLKALENVDYVLHMAAIISPIADHNRENTHRSNFVGTKNLIDVIKNTGRQDVVRFVHISTVATYGSRNYKHPWARIGDPLIPAEYDCYAMSKVMGERYVIESGLKYWVNLRQTAVLHDKLFTNNMKDGLMFHTNLNGPLEWVTANDSGIMMNHLVEYDLEGKLDGDFWQKCYNIGGGESQRVTGYDTLNDGFGLCGGRFEQFFETNWNATRNFHGVWFEDSDVLNDYLNFRTETFDDFWKQMAKKYWYFAFGKSVPKKLISDLVIKRLTRDTNAPLYWVNNGVEGRIKAFYGGREKFEQIPSKWEDYPLLRNGKTPEGDIDYEALRDISNAKKYRLNHGYDESKPLCDLGIDDLREMAKFRGGNLISTDMEKGNLHAKLLFECNEGHRFMATPYAILSGHWCNDCCMKYSWNWGIQARNNPFFAQVWYDLNDYDEVDVYPYFDGEDDFLRKD